MEDVFEEADALPEEFENMSADDLKRRARLLDNEIRVRYHNKQSFDGLDLCWCGH